MKGKGIRADFTVTGDQRRSQAPDAAMAAAVDDYQGFVSAPVRRAARPTTEFVASVKAGKVEEAKALFPVARGPWERIEPVAESFGDLDPMIDGREDVVEEGMEFTGFHRLEKDLWVTGLQPTPRPSPTSCSSTSRRSSPRPRPSKLNPLQLANGAKALLDEVATGKITGEEDRYSHTDLYDFDENVEGSKAAIDALRPVLKARDAALLTDDRRPVRGARRRARQVPHRRRLQALHRPDARTEVKALAVALDALGEPITKVAGVVAAT